MGIFPSSEFWRFSESIKLIVWRHRVIRSHTAQGQLLSWVQGKFALNIAFVGGNSRSWSAACRTEAAEKRWTQFPSFQQHDSAGPGDPLKSHDLVRILPVLTSASNSLSTEYLYWHKNNGTLFYITQHQWKYLLTGKALSLPGISLLRILGCQKTIYAVTEKQA